MAGGCKVHTALRQAKAIRAHSATGLYPCVDGHVDGDARPSPLERGELLVLLSDRGCRGDGGSEFDRLNNLRAVVSNSSRDVGCLRFDGGIAATLFDGVEAKTFSVIFITSVARIAFSLGDNTEWVIVSLTARTGPRDAARDAAREALVAFAVAVVLPRTVFCDILVAVALSVAFEFDKRSSVSMETVACEHVVVDDVAVLTDSALSCKVDIL